MVIDDALLAKMKEFKTVFGDIVPLRQISPCVTNEELIDAINKSIVEGKNLLPEIFGYANDDDPSKVY